MALSRRELIALRRRAGVRLERLRTAQTALLVQIKRLDTALAILDQEATV